VVERPREAEQVVNDFALLPHDAQERERLDLVLGQVLAVEEERFSAFVDLTSAFPRLASHLPVLVPDPSPHLISEVSSVENSGSHLRLTRYVRLLDRLHLGRCVAFNLEDRKIRSRPLST
jgi:hypothetical protein